MPARAGASLKAVLDGAAYRSLHPINPAGSAPFEGARQLRAPGTVAVAFASGGASERLR